MYKTEQAVALAKTMEVAALDFKAALKKERRADKSAADLRLSQMRGESFSRDDDQAEAVRGEAEAVASDGSNSSLGVSHVSIESLDTDEGTDSEEEEEEDSDALSIDLDTLQAELDTTVGSE